MNKEQQKEQLREDFKSGFETAYQLLEFDELVESVFYWLDTQLQQKEAELELKNSILSDFTQLERQYNKEIRDLKAERKADKDWLENQTEIANHLKAELTEAKKEAERLAEENTQLKQMVPHQFQPYLSTSTVTTCSICGRYEWQH